LKRDARSAASVMGFITAEIKDLQEPWMAHVDAMLADEAMVSAVHQALVQRHPQSRRRGRLGFPAEVVLRLLILKHIRNWSYAVLEREVRGNLVYRDFTRVGAAKMPDAKTMGRWGVAMGPPVIHQIHDRSVPPEALGQLGRVPIPPARADDGLTSRMDDMGNEVPDIGNLPILNRGRRNPARHRCFFSLSISSFRRS
jgi:Transposase domain (DUF772)